MKLPPSPLKMELQVTRVFFLEYFSYAQFHHGETQALKYSEHRQSNPEPEGKWVFIVVSGDQMDTSSSAFGGDQLPVSHYSRCILGRQTQPVRL